MQNIKNDFIDNRRKSRPNGNNDGDGSGDGAGAMEFTYHRSRRRLPHNGEELLAELERKERGEQEEEGYGY